MSLKEFDDSLLLLSKEMSASPLKYPGGKSRAIKHIMPYITNKITRLISPFLGGGHIETYCANRGIRVYGYDIFDPLLDFWQCLLENPKKLVDHAMPYYPFNRDDYIYVRKACISHPDKYERAAIYYILNKTLFVGDFFGTPATACNAARTGLTKHKIEKLRDWHTGNMTVQKMDFQESISRFGDNNNTLFFCDPPYYNHRVSSEMYKGERRGIDTFNHVALFDLLNNKKNWILCYNDCEYIRGLYKGYKMIPAKWEKSMQQKTTKKLSRKLNDIIILSSSLS